MLVVGLDTYPLPCRRHLRRLIEHFQRTRFVEGEGELEKHAHPAGEFVDVVVGLMPGYVDDLLEGC